MLYALLALFALYYLMPLFVMVSTSLKTLDEIRSGNLVSLPAGDHLRGLGEGLGERLHRRRLRRAARAFFWNSVQLRGAGGAHLDPDRRLQRLCAHHVALPRQRLLFTALLVGCFIPFQVVLLPMAQTLGLLGIANSTAGLIFVHVVYGLAFTTLFFRNFYVTVPDELTKAARIDGAGFFTIFWRIILPLSPPIIVVCVIWQFTQIWNDFLFGVVFSSGEAQPITVALNNLVNTSTGVKEYNVDMAAAIIAALPTLFVYVVAGKYFVRGLTAGAVKG